jgi:hypothetical protein
VPLIEELTLTYKIGKLAYDSFTTIRAATGAWWKKADFRITSSLTTMEFELEGREQVCYCVQDRSILFLRDKTPPPPFQYGTAGTDHFDELIINENRTRFVVDVQFGGVKHVRPEEPVAYNKGDIIRAVLIARSINGFTKANEYLDSVVSEWIDRATLVIIFPKGDKPVDIEVLGQAPNTAVWVPEKRQSYEIRTTTKQRQTLVRESLNPKFGMKHKIKWTWQSASKP